MISSTRSDQEETITSRPISSEKNCKDTSVDDHFSTIPGESESSGSSHGLTSQISIRLRITAGCVTESLVRGGGEMPKKVSATGVLDPQQFRFRKRVWAVGEVATLTLQTGRCWKLKNWSPGDCGGQAICHDAVHLGTSCQAASLSPKKELASGIECSHAGVSYFCRIISGEKKRKRWWFRNGNHRIFRLARRHAKQGTRSCCTCSLPSLGL